MFLKAVQVFIVKILSQKKTIPRAIGFFLAGSTLMLGFNNCARNSFKTVDFSQNNLASTGLDPVTADSLTQGKALYAKNCSACHGALEVSDRKGRDSSIIQIAISTFPQMAFLKTLSVSDIDKISLALASTTITPTPTTMAPVPTTTLPGSIPTTTLPGATTTTTMAPTPTTLPAGVPATFACDPTKIPKSTMLKLTNREFAASLKVLLNDFSPTGTKLGDDAQLTTLLSQLSSDILPDGRQTLREQALLETNLMTVGYFDAAFRAATLVSQSSALGSYPNTSSCLASATITQTCHQNWVKELASRAFRRPLSTTEANTLAAKFWNASLSKSDLLQLTFASVAQMPDFLYKIYDQGTASARGSRILDLTGPELASKMAFLLTGQAPDDTLRALANSGQISDPVILSQQVDRLLLTPQAQDMVRRLFQESYGYNRFDSFQYSTNFLKGQSTTNLSAGLVDEMDNFFIDTVLTRAGTFRDLMTSTSARIQSSSAAQVYGYSNAPGAVNLPSYRAGFLSRAALLAKRSGNYNSPVKRGLLILENVLCQQVGNPPPSAPTSVSETQIVGAYQTTRQRYASLTEAPGTVCLACHSRINHLGYSLENFDSLGRYRTVESIFTSPTSAAVATVAVDPSGTTGEMGAQSVSFRDITDLSASLATNDRALMCFTRKLKTFEGRNPAGDSDNCQMNSLLQTLSADTGGNQGSIKNVLKKLILSNDFKIWSY